MKEQKKNIFKLIPFSIGILYVVIVIVLWYNPFKSDENVVFFPNLISADSALYNEDNILRIATLNQDSMEYFDIKVTNITDTNLIARLNHKNRFAAKIATAGYFKVTSLFKLNINSQLNDFKWEITKFGDVPNSTELTDKNYHIEYFGKDNFWRSFYDIIFAILFALSIIVYLIFIKYPFKGGIKVNDNSTTFFKPFWQELIRFVIWFYLVLCSLYVITSIIGDYGLAGLNTIEVYNFVISILVLLILTRYLLKNGLDVTDEITINNENISYFDLSLFSKGFVSENKGDVLISAIQKAAVNNKIITLTTIEKEHVINLKKMELSGYCNKILAKMKEAGINFES
jgi:hypothetical protein